MNVFKRSILYITRKKIKSIIMLFILFGISTAVLSGISIKKAANIARQDSNKGMSNIFGKCKLYKTRKKCSSI